MPTSLQEKIIVVLFIIIFVTLSFPIFDRYLKDVSATARIHAKGLQTDSISHSAPYFNHNVHFVAILCIYIPI